MTSLSHFTSLTPSIHIHEPSTTLSPFPNSSSSSKPPDLILLTAWLNASQKHISKYTSLHQSLHPTSRILVITTSTLHTLTSSSKNLARLKPALQILYSLPADARILAHSFSNGGAFTLSSLAKEYAREMGRVIGINEMILDSSPGKFHYQATIRAFSLGLPQNPFIHSFCIVLLYVIFGVYKVHYGTFGKIDIIEQTRRDLNNEEFFGKEARRCYVYGENDQMVNWWDVEEHAGEAEMKGWRVGRVMFRRTEHCGHLIGDKNCERYREILERVWEGVEGFENGVVTLGSGVRLKRGDRNGNGGMVDIYVFDDSLTNMTGLADIAA